MITRQLTKARIALLASVFGLVASPAAAQMLPTGQMLTPLAAPGATFEPLVAHTGPLPETQADGAAAVAVSPDGAEMLVLTSGFNRIVGEDGKVIPEQSGQYLFRYAIDANGSHLVQTLTVPNAYSGVAWTPDGKSILIGGGEDDVVHRFDRSPDGFRTAAKIRLGHKAGNGVEVKPQTAGVAVSPDGARALVANYYNDSVSLIDLATNTVVAERDLRPGKIDPAKAGVPGGEFPFAVAWTDATHATVSSPRDRELVQLAIAANTVNVTGRIATVGEPTALLHDGKAQRLYATEDNADRIAIVDTASGKLIAQPRLSVTTETGARPLGKGVNPNGLALTTDGRLLVTLGGINALAVITPQGTIEGMVPTGWYPSAVATDKSGTRVFVVNRKSPPGPNPLGCKPKLASIKSQGTACGKDNQYIYQLEKAGLLSFPMPTAQVLSATTAQVAGNLGVNDKAARAAARTMATLRARIKHVVFIVKENRTYDQVLGDLPIGNGDPSLAILGRRLSPNHHRLAEQFVTLDNFYDSGEQSSTGWTWTTAARVTDTLEKTAPVNYAKRGLAYEAEEADRNVPTAQTMAERRATNPATPNDPDLMPGKALLTAPDADDKDGDEDDAKGAGFLWTAAIKAGLSVRNYGFADASVYDDGKPGDVPLVREPFKSKTRIWTPTDRLLATRSDIYFRGFDQRMPDYWRLLEWQREFVGQAKSGKMAALTLLRLSHDHFGNFKTAIDGVDTVETEMADNDYAVGMVLETLAKSPFRDSTMVFVVEDDAQNGADHVDARRSIALVAGAYVKQKALVSARYTTVSMIRTIGDLLGLKPISLNAALALPMTEAFDLNQRAWTYHATASDVLKATRLPIAADRFEQAPVAQACATRDAAYWARAMAGQDFSSEDRLDTAAFNAALWHGLGKGPEPVARTGLDLSADRARLLAKAPGCN